MRISLLLFLAIVLSACGSFKEKFGRKQGETLVTIDLHREHDPLAVYPMYGGVQIVLKSESGADFIKSVFIPNETGQVQISAPNGIYKAGAIGWEGNATPGCTPGTDCFPGQGQAKCDVAFGDTTFPLTGTAFTIPFVLKQVNCQNPPWGSPPFADVAYNPTGDANFPGISFTFSTGSPYQTGNWNLQLSMNLLTKNGGGTTKSGEIKLGCFPVSSSIGSTTLHVPAGKAGDDVFAYTLTLYGAADTGCATPLNFYEFGHGLASPITASSLAIPASSIAYSSLTNTITIH